MTEKQVTEAHIEALNLFEEILVKVLNGKINVEELKSMLPRLKTIPKKLEALEDKLNIDNAMVGEASNDIEVEYSIAVCDCCDEEYILESHINSQGDIVEEGPFDLTDTTPADLFRMGYIACEKEFDLDQPEETNLGLQFEEAKVRIKIFRDKSITVEVKTPEDKKWRFASPKEVVASLQLDRDVFDAEDNLVV